MRAAAHTGTSCTHLVLRSRISVLPSPPRQLFPYGTLLPIQVVQGTHARAHACDLLALRTHLTRRAACAQAAWRAAAACRCRPWATRRTPWWWRSQPSRSATEAGAGADTEQQQQAGWEATCGARACGKGMGSDGVRGCERCGQCGRLTPRAIDQRTAKCAAR
jgi:hypothetical protein